MNNQPPKIPLRFLRWFCRPDLLKYIEGDLIELFEENVEQKSLIIARLLFVWEVVKLFRPGVIRSFVKVDKILSSSLASHYLKMTFRGFARDKSNAIINVLGLSIGFAAALVIYLYVSNELSYDQFHHESENIYRLSQEWKRNEETISHEAFTWSGLGEEAKNQIPGLKEIVRVHSVKHLGAESLIISNQEKHQNFFESEILYVDVGFLDVFNFPLDYGEKEAALSSQNSVLISKEHALKYFGREDVIGETLHVYGGSIAGDFVITGVLSELPDNSHLQFDMVMTMDFLLSHYGSFTRLGGWSWTTFATYVKTEKDADLTQIERQLNSIIEDRKGQELAQNSESIQIHLQPISDIHLHSELTNEFAHNNGHFSQLKIVILVGALILIVAWLNYIN